MVQGRRLGLAVGITALVAVMAVALIGVLRGSASTQAPTAAATVDRGTAHVATGAVNTPFAVSVTQLQRDATLPGAPVLDDGLHYVTLRVSFQNQSAQQQRADPRDFRLVDAVGNTHSPTFLPASSTRCTQWQRADLSPNGPSSAPPRDADATQAGRSFGPEELCFVAGGDPRAALTLVWDPDVSFPLFDSPTRIPLQ